MTGYGVINKAGIKHKVDQFILQEKNPTPIQLVDTRIIQERNFIVQSQTMTRVFHDLQRAIKSGGIWRSVKKASISASDAIRAGALR